MTPVDPRGTPDWWQRPAWIVVALVLVFPVGLGLMWAHAPWSSCTKQVIISLRIWPAGAWWLWRSGRSGRLVGAAVLASVAWLAMVVGLVGALGDATNQPASAPASTGAPSEASAGLPQAQTATASAAPIAATVTPTVAPVPMRTSAPATIASPTASAAAPQAAVATPAPTQTATPLPPATARVRAVSVTDGDTLRVAIDGAEERLRLIGINAPESGECYADQAAARLAQLVAGADLRLERDVSDRNQFGRVLRYVYVGDLFVNNALVREGYVNAYRYEPDTAMADRLDASEAAARTAGLGLWAANACGAVAAGTISVVGLHVDAGGTITRT
jgi:micrococcal nuclease